MTTKPRKQIILAAYFAGVNESTVWEHPQAESQIAFDSFKHLAQTAERGKFDYFFLAEGLALRERDGVPIDTDIVGRPDSLPVLTALAAVTQHIGLIATINATFNEPYELARQLATADHLSGGRIGWNVVTSLDAFTGQNFRRGGFLQHRDRYVRAEEFVSVVRKLWDSWGDDVIVADKESGTFITDATAGSFAFTGEQFDIEGRFTVPRSPQGHPIIVQAGISPQGRDFAAQNSDLIFSPFASFDAAREYYVDVKARARGFGRNPDDLKIIPAAGFVIGDTEAEAAEKAEEVFAQQYTDRVILGLLEQVWNRDLSQYDVDGPLPDVDPDTEAPPFVQGRVLHNPDRAGTVRTYRELAEAKNLTIRGLAREVFPRASFVGTAEQVADALDSFVQNDGSDGFTLGGHHVPHGLDEFVEKVVPLLQEKGSLRENYTGTTLRENLGLAPAASSALATIA